jgi:hypothetical protein
VAVVSGSSGDYHALSLLRSGLLQLHLSLARLSAADDHVDDRWQHDAGHGVRADSDHDRATVIRRAYDPVQINSVDLRDYVRPVDDAARQSFRRRRARRVAQLSLTRPTTVQIDMGHGVTYTMNVIVESITTTADTRDVTMLGDDYQHYEPGRVTARVELRGYGVTRQAA